MPKNIVLCFPVEPGGVEQIKATAGSDYKVIVSSRDEIAREIFDADIFCGHAKVPLEWDKVVSQGRLKWIQSSAAGLDHCLVPEVIASEIVVTGCSGLFSQQVAEHTMALLFGLLRSIPTFVKAQNERVFERRPTDEIQGKTVGIIGFGGNGQRIAKVLTPFCQRIIATDCFPYAPHSLPEVNVLPDTQLIELLSESDIVIVTLPLSKANEQLIGQAEFAAMQEGAYFVNVGRGSVVDSAALIEAIESGRLAGAALDVVDPEPLPQESPFWDLRNTLITPHVGAQSATRIQKTVDLFCDNIRSWAANEPPLNLVDKQLGFPSPKNRIRLDV